MHLKHYWYWTKHYPWCIMKYPQCNWLLILSALIVDPPQINSQQCWSSIASLLTIGPLTVDCWSAPPGSTVEQCLIIDCLTVDHWPSHCWLLIPPGSTVNSVDHQSPHCWLSTLSLLTVWSIPPRINSQQCWSSITSLLTVDPPPYRFQLCNL